MNLLIDEQRRALRPENEQADSLDQSEQLIHVAARDESNHIEEHDEAEQLLFSRRSASKFQCYDVNSSK